MECDHPEAPKPLVTVAGRSLLERNVQRLFEAGVDTVHVALHHRADEIREHLLACVDLPVERLQLHTERRPLGTMGALTFLNDRARTVLSVNGDLFSAIDLDALLADHEHGAADLTIATHDERHQLKLGEVVAGPDGEVLDYLEKPVKRWRISSGTYVIGPRVQSLATGGWLPFPELVQRALSAELCVREHLHDAPWFDVNDAEGLAEARAMAANDPVAFGLERLG
jgi:NDP-sugar pyrophosphorylase family protein